MLLSDFSLMESVVSKLVEKADSIADLRKGIINYTNNFREFKNMKANIINSLFEYEDSFFQLSHIIKSVTDTNINYLQIFEKLKAKHFEYENRISQLENENKRLTNLSESIQNNFLSMNEFNKDKDSFIKDLINKVNYLENVLKEYQKKYYIPKYSKIFEFNPQLVDAEKVRKLYKNMKIMEQMKKEEIEKNHVELKKELESKAQHKAVNSVSDKDKEGKIEYQTEEIIRKQEEDGDFSDKQVSKKIAERPKTPGNLRLKQPPQRPSNQLKENQIEMVNTASFPLHNHNINSNPTPMDLDQNEKEVQDNFLKLDNAAESHQILLKVFSNPQLNFYFKRKYGEDYQTKVADLNVETEFLKQINSDISSFNEKESYKSNNFNMQEINDCLRSLSPKNYDFSGEYHPKKKPFNPYTKKTSDFFDSNIQYGGESHVLRVSREFLGTNWRSSKSQLGTGKDNFSSFNPNRNHNNNSKGNFFKRDYFERNIEEYQNAKGENDERFRMSHARGLSSHGRKLSSDFFINNKITSDLLRKPIKFGEDSHS